MMETAFVTQLSPDQRQQWIAFFNTNPHSHPTQHPDWGEFLRTLGYQPYYFLATNGGRIVLIVLCVVRPIPLTGKTQVDLLRGPVCEQVAIVRELLPELLTSLRKLKAAIIRIKPLCSGTLATELSQHLQSTGWQPRHDESHHTLEVNLTPPTSDILRTFKSAVRYEIRHAEKVGVTVRAATTDEEFIQWFNLYVRMCAGKGISLPNGAFHKAQWDLWLKHQHYGALLLAHHEEKIVAGSVVFCDARRCTYFYGASVERIPGVPLGEPLQWQAIQWAKLRGCTVYDLGGFHPDEPAGTRQYHVDRFKLGFSQNVVEYLPVHELVLDRFAQAILLTGKRAAPRVRAILKQVHR